MKFMNVRDVQNSPRRSTGWVGIPASPLEKIVNSNSPKELGERYMEKEVKKKKRNK